MDVSASALGGHMMPAPSAVVSYLVYVVPMNLALGGALMAFVADLLSRRGVGHAATLARRLSRILPVLLFLAVLFGCLHLFFFSRVLVAESPRAWMRHLAFVVIGYASLRIYQSAWDAIQSYRPVFVLAGFLCLAVAAYFMTAGAAVGHGGSTLPRFLHNLFGGFVVTGAGVALYALAARPDSTGFTTWALRHGLHWSAGATAVEIILGTWWLMTLPREVLLLFMGRSAPATAVFAIGVTLPLVALVLIVFAIRSPAPRLPAGLAVVSMALTLVLMVIMRGVVLRAGVLLRLLS